MLNELEFQEQIVLVCGVSLHNDYISNDEGASF